MRSIVRIFFTAGYANPWVILLLLLASSIFQGIGLASLMPFVVTATNQDVEDPSPLVEFSHRLFDALGTEPNVELLLFIMIGGIVLKSVFQFFGMMHVGYTVAKVATGLRAQLLRHIFNVKWSYFVHQPVGRIANSMSVDATRAGEAYLNSATFLVYAIQTVVYVVVALLVSWQLAIAALSVGLVISVGLHFLTRMMRRASIKQTKRTRDLVADLSDVLGSVKPLKAMAKQGHFAKLFDDKIAKLRLALRRQVVSRYGLAALQDISAVLIGGAGFYVAWVYWNVPISELLVMALLFFQAVSAIGKVQKQYQTAVLYEPAFLAVRALIDEAEAAREVSSGTKKPSVSREIRLDRVTFRYEQRSILQDVSMLVPAGEITVLTGPSGAGKTTVVDLIVGLHRPEAGDVLIDGVPLAEIDLAAWRSKIGYVSQDLVLFHDSILANLTLGDTTIAESDVMAALEAAGAAGFVAALPEGLRTIVGEKGTKLSGGQRQRIALARALIGKPELLILDEVTSALDPAAEAEICRQIAELAKKVTVLAITHRKAWSDIADRVYNVGDGGIELAGLREATSASL
jgi:ATP-binding cassette, subfamily C, bacterial